MWRLILLLFVLGLIIVSNNADVAGGSASVQKWLLPPVGCVKANIDGAFDCVAGKGGVEVIFTSDNGVSFSCKASSAFMVEALALGEAVNMAVCSRFFAV